MLAKKSNYKCKINLKIVPMVIPLTIKCRLKVHCLLGPARSAQLLSPVALTSDKYGNIYIGDHDFIRKLDTSGNVSSLFSTRNPPTKVTVHVSKKKYMFLKR